MVIIYTYKQLVYFSYKHTKRATLEYAKASPQIHPTFFYKFRLRIPKSKYPNSKMLQNLKLSEPQQDPTSK